MLPTRYFNKITVTCWIKEIKKETFHCVLYSYLNHYGDAGMGCEGIVYPAGATLRDTHVFRSGGRTPRGVPPVPP